MPEHVVLVRYSTECLPLDQQPSTSTTISSLAYHYSCAYKSLHNFADQHTFAKIDTWQFSMCVHIVQLCEAVDRFRTGWTWSFFLEKEQCGPLKFAGQSWAFIRKCTCVCLRWMHMYRLWRQIKCDGCFLNAAMWMECQQWFSIIPATWKSFNDIWVLQVLTLCVQKESFMQAGALRKDSNKSHPRDTHKIYIQQNLYMHMV